MLKKDNTLIIISFLKILSVINSFIYDLFLCFFTIIAIYKINYSKDMLKILIEITIFLWIIQFILDTYKKIPYYWNVNKLSKSLIWVLALFGFLYEYNNNFYYFFIISNLILLNFIIGLFVNHFLSMKHFSFNKKETLFHELGHYYMCKEFNILNPERIDLNTMDDSRGRLIVDGNIEAAEPIQFVKVLLSGYITEKYLLHNQKNFKLRDLRNILLLEYEDKDFSDEYLKTLIVIYLRDYILENAVKDIISIIEKNRNNIFENAKKNKYKKKINVKFLRGVRE